MTAEVRFPSYHAPQADRQILCVPYWATIRQNLSAQRDAIDNSSVEILGIPIAVLAREARRAVVEQAVAYTQSYTDIAETPPVDGPLIITGHQPELVHPGVWLKNFAAAQLAQEVGGTAINLVIDNDLCRSPSIRVPTGTVEQPRAVNVPYDLLQQEMPYEERTIADRALWHSFGDRVTQTVATLVSEPLIANWWNEAVEAAETTPKLGLAIARARHRLQQKWGSPSLEIPQSDVCRTAPFHRFAIHLLSSAARLRRDYNSTLGEYRQVHRLRSTAQPLPDLMEVDDWIEAPFWVWTPEDLTRRALFVRSSSKGFQLSDRHHWQETLPTETEGAMQQLAHWQQMGVKLRTRALITTMYARLLLADSFIHGIGGAKYDQVTDAICSRFFGIAPPSFVAMSGTLRLPIEHVAVSPTRFSKLRRVLRELRYHPEVSIRKLSLEPADQTEVDSWVEQKEYWVQTTKTKSNAAERHRQIVAANQALQPWLRPKREEFEQELSVATAQLRTNRLLDSREYPFCLFPHDHIQDFLLDFSRSMP